MGLCGDFYAISGALLTRQKIGCRLGRLQAESFGGQLVLFFSLMQKDRPAEENDGVKIDPRIRPVTFLPF